LIPPQEQIRFESDPEGFLQSLKLPVVLDEVQNVPHIFNHLKKKIDETPEAPYEYIFTVRHQFQMMKHVTESLAGRVLIKELLPFLSAEYEQIDRSFFGQNFERLLSHSSNFHLPSSPIMKDRLLDKVCIGCPASFNYAIRHRKS